MRFSPDLIEEVNALLLFNLDNTLEGIKVHKSAEPERKEAVKRLYEKKLISQDDGGYLTDLGRETLEHAEAMLIILTTG